MPEHTTAQELDAIAMLLEDHRALRQLFGEFARADRGDVDAYRGIVELACAELAFHTTLEEEIFYPAARAQLGSDQRLIDEAEADHERVLALIARLRSLAPGDPSYFTTFTLLAGLVNDHIAKEEATIFPRLENLPGDLHGLAAHMRQRKDSLLGAVETPAQAEPSLEADGVDEPAADDALREAEHR